MVVLDTAVVLAAGMGRRMGALSKFYPKPLIPIANRPLIDWVLSSLLDAGLKRIIVVVGYMGGFVKRHVESAFSYMNVECVYAEDYVKGAGYSLLAAEEYVSGSFMLSPADLILDPKIAMRVVNGFLRLGVPLVATGGTGRRGTVISTSEGRCGSVVSMRRGCGSERVCIGLVALDSSFFKFLRRSLNSGNGSVVSALDLYVREGGSLGFIDFPGACWFDVDTVTEALRANSHLLSTGLIPPGCLYIPPGEEWPPNRGGTGSSTFLGPVLVTPEASVEGSRIGPNVSLSGRVSCENALVLNAVVFGGCRLKGAVRGGIYFNNMFFGEGSTR
ncbi:MAG: phosphocholine cytidylyltransferase family protein [Candidatus Freyarchaeota archaeon]|nr:NDP-sugar synthase [Candidatus Freyrarchaeum guaymaensis]